MGGWRYRVQQVWDRYRGAPLDYDARAWVEGALTPAQRSVFYAQERADQHHAYTVARTLHDQGQRDPRLLQAALLHDCGKAPGVSLPFRTLYVLASRFAPSWLEPLSPHESGWRAPLARAIHHPRLGAELAARAGSSPDVVRLIAEHQEDRPDLPDELEPLHRALKRIDEQT